MMLNIKYIQEIYFLGINFEVWNENYKCLLTILDTCLKEKEKMYEKEEPKKDIRKKLIKPNTNH